MHCRRETAESTHYAVDPGLNGQERRAAARDWIGAYYSGYRLGRRQGPPRWYGAGDALPSSTSPQPDQGWWRGQDQDPELGRDESSDTD